MSAKRNRKARPRSLKAATAPSPGLPRLSLAVQDPAGHESEDAGWAEMSGNDGDFAISTLSFRQQAALPAIALAPTLTQAACDSGIGESTLRRWLQAPGFQQHLANFRHESADLARQQAQALLPRCLSVFAEVMEAPDPSLRLRAARYATSFALQLAEVQELKVSLQALEQAVQARDDASPPKLS